MATVATGPALGTSPPAPTVVPNVGPSGGGDLRGTIRLGTGTTPAAGRACSVTLDEVLDTLPNIVVNGGNAASGPFAWSAVPTSNGSFDVYVTSALGTSQALGTYVLYYTLIKSQND